MKIRRFTADTMTLALQAVKAALGSEAVILETAEVRGQAVVTAAIDDDEPFAAALPDGDLTREVRALLGVVRQLVDVRWATAPERVRPEVACLHHRLMEQGLDGVIAAALVRATAERLEADPSVPAALAGTLAATVGGPGSMAQPRVRVFVGPPGDGKTTTIVKLAAIARREGRRVALVGTDTYRMGAAAALEGYGRVLGVEVASAAGGRELGGVLRQLCEVDLVLVDTAGVSPGQADELAELAELTRVAGPGVARTLVASATHGRAAAHATWQAFAPLAPDSCVLTKADVAPGGPVVGLCWRQGVPVSHLGTGRRVPDDLEPATAERLARCLLAA